MIDRAQLAVEQWQQQRPDLDTLPMRLIGRLGEAGQVLNRDVLQPFFDEHRLHYGEFDVLATLRRAGAPHALSPTALYEAAMISSGGMTNRLDRLERAGLIERKPPTSRAKKRPSPHSVATNRNSSTGCWVSGWPGASARLGVSRDKERAVRQGAAYIRDGLRCGS